MKRCMTVLCCVLFVACSNIVFGEIIDCTPINSLPTTISSQGVYCLTGHLATAITSGNAITISANNVTLDLNGWKIGGNSAGTATMANGIFSAANNVTVRNGIVRGFYDGITLTGSSALLEEMIVDGNFHYGIHVEGQSSLVRKNQVVATGGSTAASDVDAVAIMVQGSGNLIEDNAVFNLEATGNGYEWGIDLGAAADQSTLKRNVIIDDAKPAAAGYSSGIRIGNTFDVIVIGNKVTNFHNGIEYFGAASGKYAHNVVVDCSSAYLGGTAGSDND